MQAPFETASFDSVGIGGYLVNTGLSACKDEIVKSSVGYGLQLLILIVFEREDISWSCRILLTNE